MNLDLARASNSLLDILAALDHGTRSTGCCRKQLSLVLLARRRLSAAVRTERPRESELTQLVPDHVLRDVHGDELVTFVDCQCVTHEIGRDHGASGPRLNHPLLTGSIKRANLLEELLVDVRSLFRRTTHRV